MLTNTNKAFDSQDHGTEFQQPLNCILARITELGAPEQSEPILCENH